MCSSNWILPGPIRPSGARSIRTLSEGSDFALDFAMKYLLTISFRAQHLPRRIKKADAAFYEPTEPVTKPYDYGAYGVAADMNYPSLFSPLQIGPYQLKHR